MYSLWDTNFRLQTNAYNQETKIVNSTKNFPSFNNTFKPNHTSSADPNLLLQNRAFIKEKAFYKPVIKKINRAISNVLQKLTRKFTYIGYDINLKKTEILKEIDLIEKKESKSIYKQIEDLKKSIDEAKRNNLSSHQIEKMESKLETLNKKVELLEKVNKKEQKGNEVREQLKVLGGEQIVINTSDQVKLDGMYLDARKFRETLKNAGGKLVTYQIPGNIGQTKNLNAISLSKEKYNSSGKQVLEALKLLHGTSDILVGGGGAGWTTVYNNEEVLLVRSQDISAALDSKEHSQLFKYDHANDRWKLQTPPAAIKSEQEIKESDQPSGTVVLCLCAKTVYEMHKEDALFYLYKNMNVVLFNYRGYGKSEGTPSDKGLKIDVESAFQFARNKSGHENEKILFSATCLGGGPAAYVASKHPKTNIFLDQSYSNFKRLSKELVEFKLKEFLSNLLNVTESESLKAKAVQAAATTFSSVINLFTGFMVPNFEVDKYLSKIDGKKAFLFTKDDEIINIKHLERNLNAIPQDEMKNVTVFSVPGKHGARITTIESARIDYMRDKVKLYELYSDLVNKRYHLESNKKNKLSDKEELEILERNITQVNEDLKFIEGQPNTTNTRKRLQIKFQDCKEKKEQILQRDSKIKKLEIEIDEIKLKIAQILPAELEESIIRRENVAMNQLSHFLKKANISNDLI